MLRPNQGAVPDEEDEQEDETEREEDEEQAEKGVVVGFSCAQMVASGTEDSSRLIVSDKERERDKDQHHYGKGSMKEANKEHMRIRHTINEGSRETSSESEAKKKEGTG